MLDDRVRLAGEQRLVELEPVRRAHDAVGRDLVAGAQLEEVVEHDVVDRDLDDRRRRARTRAIGALSTASWSSVRFARYSCTIPISALTTSTKPKRPSAGDPNTRISASIVPRIALKRVKRFARTISRQRAARALAR